MNDNETQDLYNVIAILVKRLGGKVVIKDEEIRNPPYATVTKKYADHETTIEVA